MASARPIFFFMSSWAKHAYLVGLLIAAGAALCSAQMFPVSKEGAAKVISLNGDVSALRDTTPWALNVGDEVQIHQVIITGPDGYAKFQVSDGSTFEVYPNSNIVFRKNPGNWRDLLDVLVGRVKIHIQKLGGQPNNNRVLTPTAVISVRGTTFDVSVDDDDDTTIVSVEEGVVDVRHALRPSETKTLNAGESIHVYKDQPLAQSTVDKGAVVRKVLQGLRDAAFTMATHAPAHPGSTIPGGLSGQTPAPPPPPGPPPPAGPPPPPN
ncbi:MAG TPA: FecR family protein [Bryobacteraceae bacterium]|nr:FecR family protein [Bryobacteraceae bacterium]